MPDMTADSDLLERFDKRDIAQTAVGSLAGALIYAYQTDVARLADLLPLLNVAIIILATLALSMLIGYGIGVRRIGKKKMRMFFGTVPIRLIVHYGFAVIFSALILLLLGINSVGMPFGIMARRIVVLALPATLLGSAIDLVGSQKEKE